MLPVIKVALISAGTGGATDEERITNVLNLVGSGSGQTIDHVADSKNIAMRKLQVHRQRQNSITRL